MGTKKFILQTFILATVLAGCFTIEKIFFERKTVFVDLGTIYEKFEYAKVLHKKAEDAERIKNNILDSLKYHLEVQYRQLQADEAKSNKKQDEMARFNLERREYLLKKEKFEKTSVEMMEQYDKQIWTQINKYIEDFGKERGVEMILGVTGNGNIMYGNDASDMTQEIIEYINQKHKGA